MSKHICNKERELGIMTEKIVNIEKSQKRVEKTLDNFIISADKKYATKDELTNVVSDINRENKRQDEEIKWSKEKIFEMAYKLGMIAGIIFLTFKIAI